MKSHQWSLAVAAVLTCFGMAHAQNSASSSHFVFDDNFDGDIIINIDVSSLNLSATQYYLHLKCTDILGRESDVKVVAFGKTK
jgi:hypothetical protein